MAFTDKQILHLNTSVMSGLMVATEFCLHVPVQDVHCLTGFQLVYHVVADSWSMMRDNPFKPK